MVWSTYCNVFHLPKNCKMFMSILSSGWTMSLSVLLERLTVGKAWRKYLRIPPPHPVSPTSRSYYGHIQPWTNRDEGRKPELSPSDLHQNSTTLKDACLKACQATRRIISMCHCPMEKKRERKRERIKLCHIVHAFFNNKKKTSWDYLGKRSKKIQAANNALPSQTTIRW